MSPLTDEELAEDQRIFRSLKARGLTEGDREALFKEHRTPYSEYRRFLRILDKAYPPRKDGRRNHRARLPRLEGRFTPPAEGPNGPRMHKLSEEQR